MRTGKDGIELIKSFEGLELKAYKDPIGIPTIGYGHIKDVQMGDSLSNEAEAVALLQKDLLIYEKAVNNAVKVTINQNQFDALVSFTYNLGGGALRKSTLLKRLNSGNMLAASKEFRRWVKAGGRTLKGLVRRREAERVLFMKEDLIGYDFTDDVFVASYLKELVGIFKVNGDLTHLKQAILFIEEARNNE